MYTHHSAPYILEIVLYCRLFQFRTYLASLLDCECRDFISFISSHLYQAQALALG